MESNPEARNRKRLTFVTQRIPQSFTSNISLMVLPSERGHIISDILVTST